MTEPERISEARQRVRSAVAHITDAIEARDIDGIAKAVSALTLVAYDLGLTEGFLIAVEHADAAGASIDFGAARDALAKELRS